MKTDTWYSKELGDGMMASMPLDEIGEAFMKLFSAVGKPPDMAIFTRYDSEGHLHCEVTAYFSPAAKDVALAFDAEPCERPSREGLGLLAGDKLSWSKLFPESH
ncbi:MAG: hypothetical protein HZB50_12015 [Chloroflexi bacterium]|nr:hypothetical protein [Chloroflexota bacterium]